MQGRRREIIVYEIPKSDIQKLERWERAPASMDSPSSLYVCWWQWSCSVVDQSKCWVHMTEWSIDFHIEISRVHSITIANLLLATRIFYVDTLIVNVLVYWSTQCPVQWMKYSSWLVGLYYVYCIYSTIHRFILLLSTEHILVYSCI